MRARHGVPPVTIDPNLVAAAKARAQVASTYNQLDENHQGKDPNLGENMYWGASMTTQPAPATDATKSWYSEIVDYNYTTAAANPGFTTGHFTQLLWQATTTIGAARAAGQGSQFYETYIVAEFSPPGNVDSQYAANVPSPVQGPNSNLTMRWTSFDGTAWTPDILMTNEQSPTGPQTAAGPALAVFSPFGVDNLYCVHRGGNDPAIWYTTWPSDTQIPNSPQSAFGPAVTSFSSKLYCVHRGNADNGLWVVAFDGMTWSTDTRIPGVSTAAGPALAVFNNTLYCVHRGDADGYLWVTTSPDGANWSTDTTLPNHPQSAFGPALALFNNTLYCVHRGGYDSGLWVTTTSDGTNWSTDTRIGSFATAAAPAVAVWQNKLYVAYRGDGTDTNLRYITYDGTTWSQETAIPGAASTTNPGLAAYHNRLYCAHRG